MGERIVSAGSLAPFDLFEVENKLRHVEGVYKGVCCACPDGKFFRVSTKYVARMAGFPEEEWDRTLFDSYNVIGGSKGFLDPMTREATLYQVDFLLSGHGTNILVIIDHERCYAYKRELENSPLRNNERLFHFHRLQEAGWVAREGIKVPDLTIVLAYASMIEHKIRFEPVPFLR